MLNTLPKIHKTRSRWLFASRRRALRLRAHAFPNHCLYGDTPVVGLAPRRARGTATGSFRQHPRAVRIRARSHGRPALGRGRARTARPARPAASGARAESRSRRPSRRRPARESPSPGEMRRGARRAGTPDPYGAWSDTKDARRPVKGRTTIMHKIGQEIGRASRPERWSLRLKKVAPGSRAKRPA